MSPGMWKDMIWRLPLGKDLVAAGEPFQDRAALRWSVMVTDDIRVCFKLPYRDRQSGDGPPFIV